MHYIIHILEHSLIDSLKILPSLFIIYFLIEYLEHKNNNRAHHLFMKSKKAGPIFGGLFGSLPQCGFSVIASELYSKGSITLGTLFAVFIATSDEAIPILLSAPSFLPQMLMLIVSKLLLAVFFGFLIDLTFRRQGVHHHHCHEEKEEHKHFHGNCESCHDGILKSTLIHVVKIFVFIFLINFAFGLLTEQFSIESLKMNKWLMPFVTSLVGLIPNCASSVLLTKLYMEGALTLSALIGGLSSSAGVGLIILFRLNKSIKNNMFILLLLYLIGALSGLLLTPFM